MSFTKDEATTALLYAHNGAMFMYRSDIYLSAKILSGDTTSDGMSDMVKEMLISRTWINIDSAMVIKYCLKNLDKKNTYIFDNGDIKVIPEPFNTIKIS